MQIILGGHLDFYDPHKRSSFDMPLAGPIPLSDLIEQLDLPRAEIAICVLNGSAVTSFDEVLVSDEDKLALYPYVGGGCVSGHPYFRLEASA
jgi:sulfur carrier protein ThiS